jgi:hypothetical protein
MVVLESVEKINYSKSSILVTNENYAPLISASLINPNENNHAVPGDILIIREGLYAVALTEASAYSDIVIKSESFLIPTTVGISLDGTTLTVESTAGFTEPESAEAHTAYIDLDENKAFTYTGLTATTFTGVELLSGATFSPDDYITSSIETDTSLYDYSNLLPTLGDRIYKKNQSNTSYLYTQEDLDYLSKAYLKEYVKNHGKLQAEVLFAPYLKIGQTISVTDSYNGLDDVRYFIESISYRPNNSSVTLARYPG